jgi:hypothetical protein
MPRNGSGTYTRPQSDYIPGTTILATSVNSDLNDMAQALTASIARDGQTIPTANLPMGNFRHTGVSDGTARTDYAALGQVQNGEFVWGGTASGTANAATISLNPPLAAYAAGQAFRFQTGAAANTSAVTLNVNSLGAVAVNKGDGTLALGAGDLPASAMVTVVHDGTRFRLVDVASDAPWVDLASATTTNLSTVGANVRITGTTTITGFGTAPSGTTRKLRFAAALTLTHNATSLILPGAANITTAAGDTAEAISLGSGNWVMVNYQPNVDVYAQKSYVDNGDRWVQLSSTAITAVSQIDLTWTGGAYLLYKIYILGLRPGAATNNDLTMRVRRNGTFLAGATDYNTGDSWWNATAVGVSASTASYSVLAQAGMNLEPMLGEVSLMQAATTERIVIDAKTRYTSNTPGHSRAIFTSNTDAGSGWLDGVRILFLGGATNFAAVGRIVVMGMKS